MRSVLLLAFFALVAGRLFPTELSQPKVTTESVSHSFQVVGGNSTVKYIAEHEANVVSLEMIVGLDKIRCGENALELIFTDPVAAESAKLHIEVGSIIVGGRQFGCANVTTGKSGNVLREVKSIVETPFQSLRLRYTTVPASLGQVLRNAHASIVFHPHEFISMDSCGTQQVVTGQCTADLHAGHTFDGWKKDYSTTLWSQGMAALRCSSCYVQFQPAVSVDIHIRNNQLTHLEVTIQGTTTVHHEITLGLSGSYSTNGRTNLGTINLPSAAFFIGAFPVTLDFQVPIDVGFNFNAAASATISGGVELSDTISAGMIFNNGQLSHTWGNNFGGHSIGPTITLQASADLQVYVAPKLDITFEHVCTLGIELQPYVEFSVNGKNTDIHGNIYAGLAVNIDGNLGLNLDGVGIGPQTPLGKAQVENSKRSVWSR